MESKPDEQKWEKQIMKKRKHKKILKNSQVALEDLLYCMVNKPGCARKIILSAFDKPSLQDFDKQYYEASCCTKYIPESGHIATVDAARKVKASAPRPKAKKFERLAIIDGLEKWQDCVGLLKFKGNRLAQDGQYKFFMSESIIKLISRGATAFTDVDNLQQAAVKWLARLLNKYVDKVFEVVKDVILHADLKVTGTSQIKNRSTASKRPSIVGTELEFVVPITTPTSFIPPPSSPSIANATSVDTPKTHT